MSVAVRRPGDLEWEELSFGRFAARVADLARPLGAVELGYNFHEIPPGKASVPYHAHLVNEEMVVILEGEAWIRLDGREHRLAAGHVVALPPGPESAHQLLNRSDAPVRALLASTMIPREVVEYPDSGKRLVSVGGLARDPDRESVRLMGDRVLRGGPASYFDGEPTDEPVGEPPAETADPDPRIVHVDDVEPERIELGPFRAERRRLSRAAGARLLGYNRSRVEPGERPWPYHFHHVNEEAFFVLAGEASLRTAEGERAIGPGDVVACPPGRAGAHAFRATGEEPLDLLALSTMKEPDVIEYLDSEKVHVMVGSAPGGDLEVREVDLAFRRADAIGYLEGET